VGAVMDIVSITLTTSITAPTLVPDM